MTEKTTPIDLLEQLDERILGTLVRMDVMDDVDGYATFAQSFQTLMLSRDLLVAMVIAGGPVGVDVTCGDLNDLARLVARIAEAIGWTVKGELELLVGFASGHPCWTLSEDGVIVHLFVGAHIDDMKLPQTVVQRLPRATTVADHHQTRSAALVFLEAIAAAGGK